MNGGPEPSCTTAQIPAPVREGWAPESPATWLWKGGRPNKSLLISWELEIRSQKQPELLTCSARHRLGPGGHRLGIPDQAAGSICHGRSLWGRVPHLTVGGVGAGESVVWPPDHSREVQT